MKKCLIIQPGAFGDIFLCAPIAKYYNDRGFKVYWPARKKFIPTLNYFPYVNSIILPEDVLHEDWLRSDVMKILPHLEKYDKIVNLADRGPHTTAQQHWENFEQCKYRLSEVPFSEKNNLNWERDKNKEKEIFNLLDIPENEDYAVVHKTDSLGQTAFVPNIDIKTIEVQPIKSFNIPDWFRIFKKAKKIYCIESSVHQFMDGVVQKLTPERFLLKRPSVGINCRFTVSSNWKLDYIGKESIIRG